MLFLSIVVLVQVEDLHKKQSQGSAFCHARPHLLHEAPPSILLSLVPRLAHSQITGYRYPSISAMWSDCVV